MSEKYNCNHQALVDGEETCGFCFAELGSEHEALKERLAIAERNLQTAKFQVTVMDASATEGWKKAKEAEAQAAALRAWIIDNHAMNCNHMEPNRDCLDCSAFNLLRTNAAGRELLERNVQFEALLRAIQTDMAQSAMHRTLYLEEVCLAVDALKKQGGRS